MEAEELAPQIRKIHLPYAPRIRQILYCDFLNGKGDYPNCAVNVRDWFICHNVLGLCHRGMGLNFNIKIDFREKVFHREGGSFGCSKARRVMQNVTGMDSESAQTARRRDHYESLGFIGDRAEYALSGFAAYDK